MYSVSVILQHLSPVILCLSFSPPQPSNSAVSCHCFIIGHHSLTYLLTWCCCIADWASVQAEKLAASLSVHWVISLFYSLLMSCWKCGRLRLISWDICCHYITSSLTNRQGTSTTSSSNCSLRDRLSCVECVRVEYRQTDNHSDRQTDRQTDT